MFNMFKIFNSFDMFNNISNGIGSYFRILFSDNSTITFSDNETINYEVN